MKAVKKFWKTVRYYENDSDFFVLVNLLADLCGFYPPNWNHAALTAWMALKIGQVIQYSFYTYHCYQSAVNWRNLLYFSLNINLFVILSVGLFRALTLAYFHQHLTRLKTFVNGRHCGKDDGKANYDRKVRFWTNNRLILAGSCMLVLNAVNWCLTAAFSEDLYQIPFSLDFLPRGIAKSVAYYYSFQMLIQNFTYWQSFFQFGSLLSCLKNELSIISDYAESIFDRAIEYGTGNDLEFRYDDNAVLSKVWMAMREDVGRAARYHSNFMEHVMLLKQVTYANFLALLSATAILVTLNSFLCVIDFSSDALGLLVFGAICCMECFFTCRLLDEMDDINEEIGINAYALDWLTSIPVPRKNVDDYHSIKRSALIIQTRAQQGFGFRAGGMFDMNSEMFMQIMEMCYSWVTFLMQTQE